MALAISKRMTAAQLSKSMLPRFAGAFAAGPADVQAGSGAVAVQEILALAQLDELMPPVEIGGLELAPRSADELRLPPPAASRVPLHRALARFEEAFRASAREPTALSSADRERELRLLAVVAGVARLQAQIHEGMAAAQRG